MIFLNLSNLSERIYFFSIQFLWFYQYFIVISFHQIPLTWWKAYWSWQYLAEVLISHCKKYSEPWCCCNFILIWTIVLKLAKCFRFRYSFESQMTIIFEQLWFDVKKNLAGKLAQFEVKTGWDQFWREILPLVKSSCVKPKWFWIRVMK